MSVYACVCYVLTPACVRSCGLVRPTSGLVWRRRHGDAVGHAGAVGVCGRRTSAHARAHEWVHACMCVAPSCRALPHTACQTTCTLVSVRPRGVCVCVCVCVCVVCVCVFVCVCLCVSVPMLCMYLSV
jgi:hypothetical protein